MIKFAEVEVKDSLLPCKNWKLNEEGKWRPYLAEGQELCLPNYPVYKELPQELSLTSYTDAEYEQHFQGK